MVKRYGWNQVVLLYEDNYSLRSLQPLLDITATSNGQFRIVTKQLDYHEKDGYRPILKEVDNISGNNIVLACKKHILWEVLNHAQQVGKKHLIFDDNINSNN